MMYILSGMCYSITKIGKNKAIKESFGMHSGFLDAGFVPPRPL